MEVDRGDKMDVTRAADIIRGNESNDALPNETPEKVDESTPSFTLSSERFKFSTFIEDPSIDCIDKAGSMLADFKKKPPTLKEALESMDYGKKTEELFKMFTERVSGRLEEIEAPGLSDEDVATIFCYTYEWNVKEFGEGVDSPYRKLNQSISVERSNPALRKTRAFLFLLLRALRKLPRYTPANRTLYRGIRTHVKTKVDPEHPEIKPYAAGNEKTWWAFTSTSEDLEVTRYFVENSESNEGTLFTLSGEAWGYDISVFSNFPDEKEILLEPERRLKIKDVKKDDAIIAVDAEILDTALVLKDYIKVKPVKIKERKSRFKEVPRNLRVEEITMSTVTLLWDAPETDEKVFSYQVSARQTSNALFNRNPESTYIVRKDEKKEEAKDIVRGLEEKKDETKYAVRGLEEGKEYEFRVRCKYRDGWGKEWCEKVVIKVAFESCEWKKCPGDVDEDRKYSVDGGNPRVATKVSKDGGCTIIGNTHIPLNKVTPWSVRILKSENNIGGHIYIGVAPSDINQNIVFNYDKCGWYFHCFDSTLWSGPPHDYSRNKYGPRKGQYIHTGDSFGVVMDTAKGDLSFTLNGMNLGVAYEGIPLDKPLVPCVLLREKGDSIELDLSEVKENVSSSVPVPSNITTESGATWDLITLTWNEVSGTSFYQIEVDGGKSRHTSTTNAFTKRGLFPETEHSFRVRTVRGSSVSKWSGVVKGRTLKAPEFPESVWKTCPGDIDEKKKYSVDERNPRVATMVNDGGLCTIIGNTLIPSNTVTSWSIKILKSWDNDRGGLFIGVAPSDINQNDKWNYKCGWYFNCGWSTLCSGPPHNYRGKDYGPRKESNGQYVHTGDSVGVVVDTTKGELSFVLDGVNHGVAYEGIPLDKPLVPCVLLLGDKGDSVELIT